MNQGERIQIKYQLKKIELAEMCFHVLAERLWKYKVYPAIAGVWLLLALLIGGVKLLVTGKLVSLTVFLWPLLAVAVIFLFLYIVNYQHFIKCGMLKEQSLCMEGGCIRLGIPDLVITPCSHYGESCGFIRIF